MIPEPATVPVDHQTSIIKPYVLGHGTLECRDIKATRQFYEEFLGLECVRHGVPAMAVRLGLRFHIVCVEVGDKLRPAHYLNHWGLDVQSKEAVDAAFAAAQQHKERYGIKKIIEPTLQHGVYSFYLEDMDNNWWEVQYYDGYQHDDMFDFGDRF